MDSAFHGISSVIKTTTAMIVPMRVIASHSVSPNLTVLLIIQMINFPSFCLDQIVPKRHFSATQMVHVFLGVRFATESGNALMDLTKLDATKVGN